MRRAGGERLEPQFRGRIMLASPRLRATKLTFWDMAKQYIALPACGLGENADEACSLLNSLSIAKLPMIHRTYTRALVSLH